MKTKLLVVICSLMCSTLAFGQIPSYDKAKHYQLRSMETGPWQFWPEGWYYSWWHKEVKFLWWKRKIKLPGLGIHDKGPAGIGIGGDRYVSKYAPNSKQRALMLVESKLVHRKYEEITSNIEKVHKRELTNIADRSVDIVYSDFRNMFDKLNILMAKSVAEYRRTIGKDETLAGILIEHKKINETVQTVKKSYATNIDRHKSYSLQLEKLEELVLKCTSKIEAYYMFNSLTERMKIDDYDRVF